MLRIGVVLFRNPPEQIELLRRSIDGAIGAPPFEAAFRDNSVENVGFGAGHNLLIRDAFARPEVRAYLCLNPDAVLHPKCLAGLWAEMQRQKKPGLVEARQFPDEHPKPYDAGTHETSWASGCALLISRELHQGVGGFDERFFAYCEDVDLSWRARAAGFSVHIAPDALVHHDVMERSDRRPLMLRSAAQLGAKYGDAAFVKQMLRELGDGSSPPAVEHADAALRQVADFEHGIWFARARW